MERLFSDHSGRRYVDEVNSAAKAQGISLGATTQKSLDDNRAFFQARDNSNNTMVTNVAMIADQPGKKVIAMIIGGAHTTKIASLLRSQGRPFAVVSTNAYKNYDDSKDSNSHLRYSRKFEGLPVSNDPFSDALLKVFPVRIKPQPVAGQDWFKAESELHFAMRKAAKLYLAGAPPPPNKPPGPTPEPSMQDPDRLQFVYKGRNVSFDGTNEFVDSKKAVIVKATLFSDDEKQTKEIWIKLSRVADSSRVADQESKLFEALAASKKPEPIKPNVQVVQLDMDFKAEVTDNKKNLL